MALNNKNLQFSEAFAYSNSPKSKKDLELRVGAFVPLEGKMQGISAKKYVSLQKNKTPFWKKAVLGTLASVIASLFYFYPPVNTFNKIEIDKWNKTGIAKNLDFDGDEKSDIVQWKNGVWSIDFSSIPPKQSNLIDNFGAFDIDIRYPLFSDNTWPVVADIDSDKRADFVLYQKTTGTWYIKFTRWNVLNKGIIDKWDWIIRTGVGAACKDRLILDFKKSIYGRPMIGDYNRDGWNDLAVACSDGFWRIDYGGSKKEDYGNIDEEIQFLSKKELSQAAGWAYIPIYQESDKSNMMGYKIPDGLENSGKIIIFRENNKPIEKTLPSLFGDNSNIIVPGRHTLKSKNKISIKGSDGSWRFVAKNNEEMYPQINNIFGGLDCQPLIADFDGDEDDDLAVKCPNEWKILYSKNMPQSEDIRHIPVEKSDEFTLPGIVYFGGVTYQYALSLIELYRMTYKNTPSPLPIDMVSISANKNMFPISR